MSKTIADFVIPVDYDQWAMSHRIHQTLNKLGVETVVWAIQECLALEENRQAVSSLKTSQAIPEEYVVKLLMSAHEFPQEDRAEKLANIIRAIFDGDERDREYRPVFLDYLNRNQSKCCPNDNDLW